MIRAVFFDVDFTLIAPGPMFQASGYRAFCERYGMTVDESAFDDAVASAESVLQGPPGDVYDVEIYIKYTAHIIERMGGRGREVDACAREIYREWAACHHFDLYDDAPAVLRALAESGIRIGLISNSHRSMASFESHFELHGLIAAAVTSSEHGFMKPHPSIFEAALRLVDVPAADAIMVGDSIRQDIEGALGVGMGAILLYRGDGAHPREVELAARGVRIARSLMDVPVMLVGWPTGR